MAVLDTPSTAWPRTGGMATTPLPFDDLMARHSMANGLGSVTSVNASAVLAMQERHQIQVLATATSSVSIAAALCAMYWFCLMRRNFRRDLVLLLITADAWKSLVYLLYAVITFSKGQLKTQSPFCQAGGYMLSVGIESCDVAIVLMSLHMSLQIFPPSNPIIARHLGSDGLYRVRYWVIAAWVIIPNLMAALAFVNPGPAFQAAGAFCYLPIRPYWYRLALSWIPRYVMLAFVMGVAIRIYRHVGHEFRVFGQENDGSTSLIMPGASSVDRAFATQALASARRKSMAPGGGTFDLEKQDKEDSLAPDDVGSSRQKSADDSKQSLPESTPSGSYVPSRRPSAPAWSPAFGFPVEVAAGSQSLHSAPASRRGSHQIAIGVQAEDFAGAPPPVDPPHRRPSVVTLASVMSSTTPSFTAAPGLAPIREDKRNSSSVGSSHPRDAAASIVRNRRRAIQRQLRLLFIYPVTYIIIWIIPFVNHCLNYSDHYAQHPIFALSLLNTFCQCFLGFVDVSVFCWREKPWRHVPGSDGTFLGSFCFWRIWRSQEHGRRQSRAVSDVPQVPVPLADRERTRSQAGLLNAVKRWSLNRNDSDSPRHSEVSTSTGGGPANARPLSHRRTHSGGSDRKQLETERAHERLALERAEWRANARSLAQRRESMHISSQPASPTRKEWWDAPPDSGPSADRTIEKDDSRPG
ncbi:G protein-coupled receptor gpr1 [Teratosphaeriaceae sp. CCFEE 6253]|nr:G protein-coupled receptor gpr1 [Teratosphaeriaceae sp. CCFEE 6253]